MLLRGFRLGRGTGRKGCRNVGETRVCVDASDLHVRCQLLLFFSANNQCLDRYPPAELVRGSNNWMGVQENVGAGEKDVTAVVVRLCWSRFGKPDDAELTPGGFATKRDPPFYYRGFCDRIAVVVFKEGIDYVPEIARVWDVDSSFVLVDPGERIWAGICDPACSNAQDLAGQLCVLDFTCHRDHAAGDCCARRDRGEFSVRERARVKIHHHWCVW